MDIELDISQELSNTENALRDFIGATLPDLLGSDWLDKLGVSADRIRQWQERKATEEKRQKSGVVEERILYYADFFDLKTILKKHWQNFSDALGDWKTMEVFLTELEKLRDPEAHRRELLPHQKHLVLGIGGTIRTSLVRFRSKKETASDFFPRIESVRDSLGNIWIPGSGGISQMLSTKSLLRPGDRIDFVVTATDPEGSALEFGVQVGSDPTRWQSENEFSVEIEHAHIRRVFWITMLIRSSREYHASSAHDDKVEFYYSVLPHPNRPSS